MAQRVVPIYFTSLELENVRCFGGSQRLDLTDENGNPARWTLILGDNNVGKTTLLQCLAWMRPEPQRDKEDEDQPEAEFKILAPALPSEENEIVESLIRVGPSTSLDLNVCLRQGQRFESTELGREIKMGIRVFNENGKLERTETIQYTKISDIGEFQELHLFAYGANRQVVSENLANSELEDPVSSSRLSQVTELYDAEEILLKLDHAALKDESGNAAITLRRFKSILAAVLPGRFGPDQIEIFAPKVSATSAGLTGVHVHTFSGLVPIGKLSLGYQTMIAWTVDLAWRLLQVYPESENPLAEPAVVMVDEIDLHLHPKWQRIIIERLTNLFPATQFIATAHSPLIVQAAAAANLTVLQQEEDHITITKDPVSIRGWRVDQILTSEYFGVQSARDEKVEALINERYSLLDRLKRTPLEEERLKQIDAELEQLPTATTPEDQEAMDIIRRAAAVLDKSGVGHS